MTDVHGIGRAPIGTFARAARVTVKALRHYDSIGLLTPAWVDPQSQYRYYDWGQLDDAICIATLRSVGIPLERIADHLIGGSPLGDVLETERTRLEGQRRQIDEALEVIDTMKSVGALSPAPTRLVQRNDVPTLSLSAHARPESLHHDTERLIERLLSAAERAGIDTSPTVIGEFPLDLGEYIPIAVHLPVTEPVPAGTVHDAAEGLVPGGRFSSITHVGPRHTLARSYRHLLTGTAPRGDGPNASLGDTAIERYLDDPSRTPASEIRTEVMVRLYLVGSLQRMVPELCPSISSSRPCRPGSPAPASCTI